LVVEGVEQALLVQPIQVVAVEPIVEVQDQLVDQE
jgi:hypothetical protein